MSAKSAPRVERKKETRAAVKEAARRCFVRLGFEEASVGAITRAAGVAHGTFYVHFESKEALLDELLREFNDELAAKLAPVLGEAAGRPIEETVGRVADAFLDHWRAHRDFVECYARRVAPRLDLADLRDGLNPPMAGLLQGALRQAVAARGAGAVDAELAAQALLGMWLRVGLQVLFGRRLTREVARTTLVRLTVGAVGGLLGGGDA